MKLCVRHVVAVERVTWKKILEEGVARLIYLTVTSAADLIAESRDGAHKHEIHGLHETFYYISPSAAFAAAAGAAAATGPLCLARDSLLAPRS